MYLKLNGKRATQRRFDALYDKESAREPQTYSDNGLSMMVFITFLVLKLCGAINWSWWLVTAPLWGPFAAVLGIFLAFILLWQVFKIIRGIWRILVAIVHWDCG